MMLNNQSRRRSFNSSQYAGELLFGLNGKQHQLLIGQLTQNSVELLIPNHGLLSEMAVGLKLESPEIQVNGETLCGMELVIQGQRASEQRHHVGVVTATVPGKANSKCLWRALFLLHQNERAETDGGERAAHELPKVPGRGLYTEEARQERVQFLQEQTGVNLEGVSRNSFDPNKLMSNVEAFVGSVEIPVGVAGPLLIHGQAVKDFSYAPMATSEGALVASATRGATALSRSGGVYTRVMGQRMLRVPVFFLESMQDALFFAEWVECHFNELKDQTRRFSNYANLVQIEPQVFGKAVHVHFVYETGDAAGQNMTTTCTWHACLWLIEQMNDFNGLTIRNFMVESNLSNDKKVTYQSFLKGRGIKVMAECCLPESVLRQTLKVTPRQLVDAYQSFVTGSVAAGMVGLNINIANVIAAIFTATGQDIACVHESAIGQLNLELITDDNGQEAVYASMMLPSLVIGTVGGGTSLAHQRECLELLGCAGPEKAHRLAEIIAGYCLALDLSTLSAIASGQFASAHEKLGRNRPVDTLKLGDLTPEFYTPMLREHFSDPNLTVTKVESLSPVSTGSSIVTELTGHKVNKLVGHFPMALHYQDGLGRERTLKVMTKVKPLDEEVILMLNGMAAMCDARLAQEFSRYKDRLGFRGCHVRELAVMSDDDPRVKNHMPTVYGVYQNPEREAYVIVEELLEDMALMDVADTLAGWTLEHTRSAIAGIAEVHSRWYGREDELKAKDWIMDAPNRESRQEMQRLWEMLGVHAREEFPEWFSDEDLERYRMQANGMPFWWRELEKLPKTLIHNDFNPRNIAFRHGEDGPRMCLYDWELATVHAPQYDLAELLVFTLTPDTPADVIEELIDYHRQELERHTGQSIPADRWRWGFSLCLFDLLISRMSLYTMAHTFRHYGFMERVHLTFRAFVDREEDRLRRAVSLGGGA
ncbi:phosphotransferase [Marinobacteraceae bacterium S3BR75-40.1]